MPIDAQKLKNSIATVEAYVRAIGEGMDQWKANKTINSEVTVIKDAYLKSNGDLAGTCEDVPSPSGRKPSPSDKKLNSIDDLIDRQKRLADYLEFLVQNL